MNELPLCVKIRSADELSRGSLLGDGWREIGELVEYRKSGWLVCEHSEIDWVGPEEIIHMAKQIPWSGRLWRDPEIAQRAAWEETKNFIRQCAASADEDEAFSLLSINNVAFGIFHDQRILLIGVIPTAQQHGLARKLVEHAGVSRAATYSHNQRGNAFYQHLGWEMDFTLAVFHK